MWRAPYRSLIREDTSARNVGAALHIQMVCAGTDRRCRNRSDGRIGGAAARRVGSVGNRHGVMWLQLSVVTGRSGFTWNGEPSVVGIGLDRWTDPGWPVYPNVWMRPDESGAGWARGIGETRRKTVRCKSPRCRTGRHLPACRTRPHPARVMRFHGTVGARRDTDETHSCPGFTLLARGGVLSRDVCFT